MSDPPFGLRDYLAYGMTGVILAISLTFSVRGSVDVDFEMSALQIVLLLLGCYLLGHVVAELTAPLVIRVLQRKVGTPMAVLLGDTGEGVRRRETRNRYVGPLSSASRAHVIAAAAKCGVDLESGSPTAGRAGLTSLASAVVREVHETPDRVNRYGLLEDFCRNVAAASAVSVLVLLGGASSTGMRDSPVPRSLRSL